MTQARMSICAMVYVAVFLLAGPPGQALAQTAPAQPPTKAVVVVQQAPAAPAAPAAKPSAPAAKPAAPAAPAAKPAALPKPLLTLSVPATANLDGNIALRAVLVAADGQPVSGVAVDFATAAKFLNTNGSVLIAHSVTDAQGAATAEWQPRSEGSLTVTASFAGDQHLGAVKATAAVEVGGDRPLYQQQAGVSVPGLNAAPQISRMVSLTSAVTPWPRVSGWPLVVVLFIVWSLYARAVAFIFTIARGRAPAQPEETRS